MAVLLHDRPEAAGQKQREALRLPRTSAVVALFAFSSRMDRDSMRLFARTHGDEVRAAAIASTGQEVLELLHGGLRPQVLVLDALLTKPSVTQVLQEISTMQPDPEPAVLVLVPVPEENIEIGTVTSALNRMSAGMSKRGAEPYRGLCLRCGRPENGVLSNGQLFEGLLKELRRRLEPTV